MQTDPFPLPPTFRKVSPISVRTLANAYDQKSQHTPMMNGHGPRSVSGPTYSYLPSQLSVNRKPIEAPSSRTGSRAPSASRSPPRQHANGHLAPLASNPQIEPSPDPADTMTPSRETVQSTISGARPQPAMSLPDPPTLTLPLSLSRQEIDAALRTCLSIQNRAVQEFGKKPSAAILIAPDKTTVLASHHAISHYQHAESELARSAAAQYPRQYLKTCTLVSTWEPCVMCSSTICLAGIGRVLYAASGADFRKIDSLDNSEETTINIPCRTIFQANQQPTEVIGPIQEWEQTAVEASQARRAAHRAEMSSVSNGSASISTRDNMSVRSGKTSITVYNPEENLLGRVDEDGEYQADLKIDWMS